MQLALLILTLVALANTHAGCIHDKLIKNKKLIPINDTFTTRRMLQTNQYGPIRFFILYDNKSVDSTSTAGQNIRKMMNILTLFWERTLEVYYIPALTFSVPPGTNPNQYLCLAFQVPPNVIQNPTPNADYGILVQAADDGDTGVTAYSYPCAYSVTSKQPLWGLMHWNTYYFSFDLLSFQMNIKIGIHQSTHILGFSSILYSNFLHGKVIDTRGASYLNGSFIQQAIKDQYGCTNSSGMLLELGGGSGTSMSHWSYKAAYNQFMTAGVLISNPTISYLTLALLEQSGWYKTVHKTYGQFINWGYKKGCRMLDPNDCSSDQYCKVESVKGCDYDQTSVSFCKNQSLTNCLFMKFYVNYLCQDPNFHIKSLNANRTHTTGQVGSQFSRCFDSNLVTPGASQTRFPFRCYRTVCSSSGRTLTVQVGNRFALCMFPGQNLTVSGFQGYLICPKSFQRVCGVKSCPKSCNGNGVCLNGRCLCSSSYTGSSCSQVTSVGFASKQFIAVAQNNRFCLIGSYLSQNGDCEPCPPKCINCNVNGCRVCSNGGLPNNQGKCI